MRVNKILEHSNIDVENCVTLYDWEMSLIIDFYNHREMLNFCFPTQS